MSYKFSTGTGSLKCLHGPGLHIEDFWIEIEVFIREQGYFEESHWRT